MAYQQWTEKKACPHCDAENYIAIGAAGVSQANETEHAECFKCHEVIHSEKCFRIGTGATKADALEAIRP